LQLLLISIFIFYICIFFLYYYYYYYFFCFLFIVIRSFFVLTLFILKAPNYVLARTVILIFFFGFKIRIFPIRGRSAIICEARILWWILPDLWRFRLISETCRVPRPRCCMCTCRVACAPVRLFTCVHRRVSFGRPLVVICKWFRVEMNRVFLADRVAAREHAQGATRAEHYRLVAHVAAFDLVGMCALFPSVLSARLLSTLPSVPACACVYAREQARASESVNAGVCV